MGEWYLVPLPVGVYPESDTPKGIVDLGGNAGTWTSSLFGHSGTDESGSTGNPSLAYPYQANDGRENEAASEAEARTIRGGTFRQVRLVARCAHRDGLAPFVTPLFIGLRLVCSSDASS